MLNLEALRSDISGITIEDNDKIVQQKSRDFYWYSPILKKQLDHVTGDLLVSPKTEDELIQVLKACFKHDIPVTPRGTGTGNYGQAMPLSGGVVLSLADMNQVKQIKTGSVVCEPGIICADLDNALAETGQEMRMHPSTYHTATVGGFIAGGSGGVGSCTWGGLRDWGNVIRLRVVTMEAEPRVLELTGDDLHKVTHAYGTNGIITEIEIPVAPKYDWVDVFVAFPDFMDSVKFSNLVGRQDGLLLKLNTVVAAPAPQDYFKRHKAFIEDGDNLCLFMVAPHALDAFLALASSQGGRVAFNSATMSDEELKGIPAAFECAWNHTTLRGLRVDEKITYLQVLYPFPTHVETLEKLHTMFEGEVIDHLEFVRFDGDVTCFGLPMVRYSSDERLEEIMNIFNAEGAPIFNPHRYTLEEGGMKQTDAVQLAFKKEADPKGLLNPGKMVAWEDPDYDFNSGQTWLFQGLQGRNAQAAAE
ncbi:MAG: FAD-binding oxidoreductase [Pseudomonadota bacterium]